MSAAIPAGNWETEAVRPGKFSHALSVEVLNRIEDLERLAPEWGRLWEQDPQATPFQSPEWLLPWWRCLGDGNLYCLIARCSAQQHELPSGDLVGLWPLYLWTEPQTLRKKLFPVGLGISDYLDGLFAPGWAEACLQAMFTAIQRHNLPCHEIQMGPLRKDSPFLSIELPAPWKSAGETGEISVVKSLPGQARELAAVISRGLGQKLDYYRRRAEKEGTISFETATAETVGDWWRELLRLHQARWSRRGQPGVLADSRVQRHHEEALPGLLSRGWLRMHALHWRGRLAAIFYGFGDRRKGRERVYYYLGGFDPEIERFSPGTLVIGYAMQQALREGAREFDFLRGQEPYKYVWGGVDQPLYQRRFMMDWNSPT